MRVLRAAAFAAVAVLVAGGLGCAARTDPSALEGVEWRLVSSSARSDLAPFGITLRFLDGQAGGFSGVNHYSASYKAGTDGSIDIGTVAATLMAGPEPAMNAERAYLALLEACGSYAIDGDGRLTLMGTGGEELVYEPAKNVGLPGSSRSVLSYNNGKQEVVPASADSTLTPELRDATGAVLITAWAADG